MNLRESLSADKQLQLIQEEVGDLSPLLSMYPEEALDRLIRNKDKLFKIARLFDSGISNVTSTIMIMKCNTST